MTGEGGPVEGRHDEAVKQLRRHLDSDDSGHQLVTVPRSSLVELRTLVLGMLVGALLFGGAGVFFMLRQEATNDHLSTTDGVVVAFVQAELAEEERESAAACVDAHERYADFEDLAMGLTEAGATVGTVAHLDLLGTASPEELASAEQRISELLPEEVQPLLDRYPPPECDLSNAAAILSRPAPEPPDVSSLAER